MIKLFILLVINLVILLIHLLIIISLFIQIINKILWHKFYKKFNFINLIELFYKSLIIIYYS